MQKAVEFPSEQMKVVVRVIEDRFASGKMQNQPSLRAPRT